MSKENYAFIDGQNLYMNIKEHGWSVDLRKFRRYLTDKYKIGTAYYFLGAVNEINNDLYEMIQKAGYVLVFREHNPSMIGKKKGNVDTDIVFTVMSKIIDDDNFGKAVLVSGDGDYFKMVEYLIKNNRFLKLLSPNKKSTSSLYKRIDNSFIGYLDSDGLKDKIKLSKNH